MTNLKAWLQLRTWLQPRQRRGLAVTIWATLLTIPATMAFLQWGYEVTARGSFSIRTIGFILISLYLAAVIGPIILIYLLPGPTQRELPPERAVLTPKKLVPQVPDDLAQACRPGECVLYAGAGLSAQAGCPTWSTLVPRLLSWAIDERLIDEDAQAYLRAACEDRQFEPVADAIVGAVPSAALHGELTRIFSRASLSEAHRALRSIPFTAALTTNLDDLLERTFGQNLFDRLGAALRSSGTGPPLLYTHADTDALLTALSQSSFFILKLYGTLERPDTVLLAPVQYEGKVARNRQFAQFMEGLFFSRTLLFVGASLEGLDVYLNGIELPAEMTRRHYALVSVEGEAWRAQAEFIKRRYQIHVIPYTASEGHPEVAAFLRELADRAAALEGSGSASATIGPEASTLRRVALRNVGPFERLEIDLQPHWNVFLGDNGVGKTTILRAIAAALCGEDAQPFAARLIREKEPFAEIVIETSRGSYKTRISRRDGLPEIVVVPQRPLEAERRLSIGYAALRYGTWLRPKGPQAGSRARPTSEDLLPLVEGGPDARLDSLKQWLVNLDDQIRSRPTQRKRAEELRQRLFAVFNEIAEGMVLASGPIDQHTFEVRVLTRGQEIPIESLSQGSASLLGWISYLLRRMYEVSGDDDDPLTGPALILIDEIDAHMHPAWQRTLAPSLRRIFPAAQFIATTHSPLIVGGMEPEEIHRCWRDEFGDVRVEHSAVTVKGLSSEQILTGPNFGLPTGVDPDTELFRALSARKLIGAELTAGEEATLRDLQGQRRQELTTGGTEAQQKAFQLLMEAMDQRLQELPNLRDDVRKEAALLLATEQPVPPSKDRE